MLAHLRISFMQKNAGGNRRRFGLHQRVLFSAQ